MDRSKLRRLHLDLRDPLRHFSRDPPGVRLLALVICVAPFFVVPAVGVVLVVGAALRWW